MSEYNFDNNDTLFEGFSEPERDKKPKLTLKDKDAAFFDNVSFDGYDDDIYDIFQCYDVKEKSQRKIKREKRRKKARSNRKQSCKSGTFEIMNIDPKYSIILFCSGVLGVMRSIITDAGIRPPCAIYAVGESQNRKTTLTTFCTRLYNRSEINTDSSVEMARVSNSVPMLEYLLDRYRDCAFILDDLFRNPDNKMKKEAERSLRNILRNHADNSPRKTMRSQFGINGQLIIIAEYIIDNISDIGRCFMVYIDDAVASDRLTAAQRQPLLLSIFYYYFIKYLCGCYDETVQFIKQEFSCFRAESGNHAGHYERIYETGFLLVYVFKIICRYAESRSVIKPEMSKNMNEQFSGIISKAIQFHSKVILIKKASGNEFNLSTALLYLLRSRIICEGQKGSDCFRKGGYLYIRNSVTAKELQAEYKIQVSTKKVSNDRNKKNVKKYNNKNYLVLNWELLLEDAKTERDPILKIL